MICDTEAYIKSQLGKKTIVLEGAQGVGLDIDYGSYPFVTSSRATIAGMANGAGLREDQVTEKLGVVKAYLTRVGEGAFPTEIGGYNAVSIYKDKFQKGLKGVPLSEQINDLHAIIQGGAIGLKGHEFGATTGRLRRVGWMDLVALRHSIEINGPKIVITKLDVLSGIKKLSICVGYRYEGTGNSAIPIVYGQELEHMIPENDILKDCYPIYEYLDGWDEDISDVRGWDDLPVNAQKYLQFITKETGATIIMIRVGPKREQVFFV
jgi:adenylosuccinate synthase